MDAFTWSLPFVGAKIAEMLLAVLSVCSSDELISDSESEEEDKAEADEEETNPADVAARRQQIKNKILAVGRMQRVFQILREEAESATELTLSEDGIPRRFGGDALGVQQITRNIRNFDDACVLSLMPLCVVVLIGIADSRKSDLMNEHIPMFNSSQPPTPGGMFPVPSMRHRHPSQDGQGEINMEYLIRKTLEEDDENTELIEALAEKMAKGRRVTGRPAALKRFETT